MTTIITMWSTKTTYKESEKGKKVKKTQEYEIHTENFLFFCFFNKKRTNERINKSNFYIRPSETKN